MVTRSSGKILSNMLALVRLHTGVPVWVCTSICYYWFYFFPDDVAASTCGKEIDENCYLQELNFTENCKSSLADKILERGYPQRQWWGTEVINRGTKWHQVLACAWPWSNDSLRKEWSQCVVLQCTGFFWNWGTQAFWCFFLFVFKMLKLSRFFFP